MASSACMRLTVLLVVAALLQCTAADTYTVGDSTGWRIAPGGAQFYTNWASGKTFEVGDVLTFNFQAGRHDVAEVTKTEFDACTASNPIGDVIETSPASITLTRTGPHYFICTIPGHCEAGQKLAINDLPSSPTSTPTPTTTAACGPATPPTSGDSPTTPNAVPSLTTRLGGVTGIVAAVLSAFVL